MKKLLLSFPLFLLFSCSSKKDDLGQFSWMSGKWKGRSGGFLFYEQWSAAEGNCMSGYGCEISAEDTVFSEKIVLEQRGESFYYTPDVKENGAPVDFKFTGADHDSLIFENPAHDFPQRIIYFHTAADSMYACIDGKNKGRYTRIEFLFAREK